MRRATCVARPCRHGENVSESGPEMLDRHSTLLGQTQKLMSKLLKPVLSWLRDDMKDILDPSLRRYEKRW